MGLQTTAVGNLKMQSKRVFVVVLERAGEWVLMGLAWVHAGCLWHSLVAQEPL